MPPCQGVEHYITTIAIKGYIPGVARAGGTDGIQLRFTESNEGIHIVLPSRSNCVFTVKGCVAHRPHHLYRKSRGI